MAFNNQLAVVRALEWCHCNVKDSKTLAAGLQWSSTITRSAASPHDAPLPTEIDAKLKRLRELGVWVSAPDGSVLVTWGVGSANKGLRYNFSADDGQNWRQETITLLPDTNIAARYYSARTIQLDEQHIGTVYLSGSTVYFLRVNIGRLAKR